MLIHFKIGLKSGYIRPSTPDIAKEFHGDILVISCSHYLGINQFAAAVDSHLRIEQSSLTAEACQKLKGQSPADYT